MICLTLIQMKKAVRIWDINQLWTDNPAKRRSTHDCPLCSRRSLEARMAQLARTRRVRGGRCLQEDIWKAMTHWIDEWAEIRRAQIWTIEAIQLMAEYRREVRLSAGHLICKSRTILDTRRPTYLGWACHHLQAPLLACKLLMMDSPPKIVKIQSSKVL